MLLSPACTHVRHLTFPQWPCSPSGKVGRCPVGVQHCPPRALIQQPTGVDGDIKGGAVQLYCLTEHSVAVGDIALLLEPFGLGWLV